MRSARPVATVLEITAGCNIKHFRVSFATSRKMLTLLEERKKKKTFILLFFVFLIISSPILTGCDTINLNDFRFYTIFRKLEKYSGFREGWNALLTNIFGLYSGSRSNAPGVLKSRLRVGLTRLCNEIVKTSVQRFLKYAAFQLLVVTTRDGLVLKKSSIRVPFWFRFLYLRFSILTFNF